VLGALVVVAGAVLRLAPLEWALLVLAVALVMTVELLNTALEAVVDLASPELHPLAKHAKDVAAAAVLIASAGAVAVGALVLWARLAR
jgi:diacylglycerol kinase